MYKCMENAWTCDMQSKYIIGLAQFNLPEHKEIAHI